MKIALVLTVKNEERILRHNLLYHKAIGCYKIFVYFDNSTDQGKDSIIDLDFVEINNSVDKSVYNHLKYLSKFTNKMDEHHTARQCLNTYDAKQKCKKEQIDWLISIDADELIVPVLNSQQDLSSFFKTISNSIDVVNFKVYEVLQRKLNYTNVFAEETYFKATYDFRFGFERISKKIYNPFLDKTSRYSYWYGQHLGKAAIRVNSNIIPHNVHRYKTINGSSFELLNAGYVLHYHAYDVEDFIKKFKNFKKHPNTFLSGNKVESLKLLLRDVVNDPEANENTLKTFFKNNLFFTKAEVKKLKSNKIFYFFRRKNKVLIEINNIKDIFMKVN